MTGRFCWLKYMWFCKTMPATWRRWWKRCQSLAWAVLLIAYCAQGASFTTRCHHKCKEDYGTLQTFVVCTVSFGRWLSTPRHSRCKMASAPLRLNPFVCVCMCVCIYGLKWEPNPEHTISYCRTLKGLAKTERERDDRGVRDFHSTLLKIKDLKIKNVTKQQK